MLSILRANFLYGDDVKRAPSGHGWIYEFNRYSSDIFAKLLNVNNILTDISPYSQMFALLLVSIVSVMITYVFCNGTIKYIPLIMSTFVGLCPFAFGCWSYRFDAPVIAMSVFVCAIPLLFWNSLLQRQSKWHVVKVACLLTICLMIMWTSFQASNGLFLVAVLGLAFNDWLKQCKIMQIVKKLLIFGVPFLISGLVFVLVLPSSYERWRSTETFALDELLYGVLKNMKTLFSTFISSLNTEWKILFVLFFTCFLLSLLVFSERKGIMRVFDMLAGVTFVFIALCLTEGVYLLLVEFGTNGRYLIGAGMTLAIVGIITTKNISANWKAVLAVPGTALLYSFIVFALALGNAYTDQNRYGNFRVELLLNDLSHIYTTKEQVDKTTLHIEGNIGPSAVMRHVRSQYPAVNKIYGSAHTGLNDVSQGYFKLTRYYNRPQKYTITPKPGTFDCDSMKTLLDTYYHTIKSNSEGEVCVILK
ncbi:MAG: glucosyltransferase domain-containing protein [Bifidobacteriaceae bacterium]|jgi:hypothetical protein|nr:glucosyltransferase domain-containing protein [Bifidobacteriaceae bacterium]